MRGRIYRRNSISLAKLRAEGGYHIRYYLLLTTSGVTPHVEVSNGRAWEYVVCGRLGENALIEVKDSSLVF